MVIDLTFSVAVTNVSFSILNLHEQVSSPALRQWQVGPRGNGLSTPPAGYPAAPVPKTDCGTVTGRTGGSPYINAPAMPPAQTTSPYWITNGTGNASTDIHLTCTGTTANPISTVSLYVNIRARNDSAPSGWSTTNWPIGIANLKFCR